jgi:hypothetical protein
MLMPFHTLGVEDAIAYCLPVHQRCLYLHSTNDVYAAKLLETIIHHI